LLTKGVYDIVDSMVASVSFSCDRSDWYSLDVIVNDQSVDLRGSFGGSGIGHEMRRKRSPCVSLRPPGGNPDLLDRRRAFGTRDKREKTFSVGRVV
jgi:hypothetical protein